jgi:hypothetical protein
MKKEWQLPILEVLSINNTMASGSFGEYDEGYNEALSHTQQTGFHHVS